MAKRSVTVRSVIGPGVPNQNSFVNVRPAYRFVDGTIINWPEAKTFTIENGSVVIPNVEDTFAGEPIVWEFAFQDFDARNQPLTLQPRVELVTFEGTSGSTVEYTAMTQKSPSPLPSFEQAAVEQAQAAAAAAETAQTAAEAAASASEAIDAQTIATGAIVGNDLVLTRTDGGTVNAGNVRGPQGLPGTNTATNDAAVGVYLGTAGTDTRNALNMTGALQSRDNHSYVWLAGVMRNDGTGWAFLPTSTNHRPINVDSVEVIGNLLRVNYASIGASMTVMAMAQPDEALTGAGLHMGCSVTPTRTDISIYQDVPEYADYIYFDTGTNTWLSQLGVVTVASWSGGVLELAHPALPGNASYGVGITPRGLNWDFKPRTASPSSSGTSLFIEVKDVSPSIAGEVMWDGSAWVVPSGWSVSFDTGVLTITHPAIGAGASQRFGVTPRGSSYAVELSAGSSPMTTTTLAIRFRDAAGTPVTSAPTTSMRVWVERGGGGVKVSTAQAGMAFWVRHGGGRRIVNPATIDTTTYPLSNIWFYAVMGMEGGA